MGSNKVSDPRCVSLQRAICPTPDEIQVARDFAQLQIRQVERADIGLDKAYEPRVRVTLSKARKKKQNQPNSRRDVFVSRLDVTLPLMISSIVYSAYSSFTLPLATPSSGSGGGGKQFSITRCFRRPLFWSFWNPFAVPFVVDGSGQ
jgi:hypothetical protein